MKVLVTGGAGFIGSNLVERLLARGDRVAVLDDFNDFYDPALKRANLEASASAAQLSLYEGDICDQKAVSEILAKERPEVIVHLAARAGVRPSLLQPELYLRVNVIGTHILMSAACQAGVGHFVFASSSSVYGDDSPAPFREDALADRPISPYGATKRMGEVLAHTFRTLYGISVTAVRLFTVYGRRCRPDLAVHKFSRLMVKGEPIPVYGDGSALRDFTYVDDVLAGLQVAIDRPLGYEIINLGYGRPITVLQLVSLLEERLNVRAELRLEPRQPGDVDRTFASIEKAGRLLDWRPATPIERGLDLWCDWFLSQRSAEVTA